MHDVRSRTNAHPALPACQQEQTSRSEPPAYTALMAYLCPMHARFPVRLLLLLLGCSALFAVRGQSSVSITPIPVSVQAMEESPFLLSAKTRIIADPVFDAQAIYLQAEIQRQCGIQVKVPSLAASPLVTGADIQLVFNAATDSLPEAYVLESGNRGITLHAGSVRGIVNGIQTLLQLLPLEQRASVQVPAVRIHDYPRFAYRGMHLDVVRHFFPLDYVRKYIDYLTFHKFNTFHWHLTDDQGWRIEILSYPKLNSIGSWRDSTLIGHFRDTPVRYDRTRYGGYYTRAEIKEVLAYAEVRGITVIPEVDIPGHSRATITAYPEFSTDPSKAWGVAATWGMYNRQNNVLAPREETFRMLRTVFHEIADLFPSTYIHLGGDECSKLWWKQSPEAQAFIKTNQLKDEAGLQTYFVRQVSGYLAEKGKKVIGWHEIMEENPDTTALLMNWADDAKALQAVSRGFRVIQTPGKPFYFDHYQSKAKGDSLAIHGYNPLEAVYRYDPVPAALRAKGLSGRILGGQANVWTEYMGYPSKVDYMIFPRMTAVSEVLWSRPEAKDYAGFLQRLQSAILPRYQFWKSSWFPDFLTWDANQ